MNVFRTINSVLKCILIINITLVLLIGSTSCFKSKPEVSIDEVEDGIFELVNEIRASEELPTLTRSSNLDSLAGEYVDSQFSVEWAQSNDISYLLDNSWEVTNSASTPRLTADTAEAQVDYCMEQPDMKDAIYSVEARATGIGIAVIGDTVYYTQVFDVVNLAGGDGQPIRLSENSEATDPTWEELKTFLEQDDTDEIDYKTGVFICGDFAETLHNNAEEAGIRAAFVAVGFNEDPGHALNAFYIDDKDQTVYIDVIGGDKVAYIEVGKSYGVIALDIATDFSYSYLESYAQSVEEYEQDHEDYEEELAAYNAEVADYEDGLSLPPEYNSWKEWRQSLEAWATELNNWLDELIDEAEILGISGSYWDPTGSLVGVDDPTVVRFYVHW